MSLTIKKGGFISEQPSSNYSNLLTASALIQAKPFSRDSKPAMRPLRKVHMSQSISGLPESWKLDKSLSTPKLMPKSILKKGNEIPKKKKKVVSFNEIGDE